MDTDDRANDHPAAGRLNAEELLFRAALLARHGAEARPLAERMAAVARIGGGRSCFEGGAALQLAVDAPGEPGLQVGIRMGDELDPGALAELVEPDDAAWMLEHARALPTANHSSMGFWLHWERDRQSLFMDLRDTDPIAAAGRLATLLDADQRAELDRQRPDPADARLWAAKVSAGREGGRRVHLYWLFHRAGRVETLVERRLPGSWTRVLGALGHLTRRPGRSGRWALTTTLPAASEPQIRLNSTAWLLAPEDDRKQRAVGAVMSAHAGPSRYAESLWSLCRNTAGEGWRVGRSCEIRLGHETTGVRLYLTPQTV